MNLEKNLADWVRITQSEEIPLDIQGIDLDEIFEHEEVEGRNDAGNINQREGLMDKEDDEGNREVGGSNSSPKNRARGKKIEKTR